MKTRSHSFAAGPKAAGGSEQWQEQLFRAGFAEGTASCILEVLGEYGRIPVGLKERILSLTDLGELSRLFALARQVRTVEEFSFRM